jgi:hypothetical protein
MLQRQLALEALRKAGLYPAARGTTIGDLIGWIKNHPEADWAAIADRVRSHAGEELGQLALAVWRSDDKVLRANILRNLDPARPTEAALIKKLLGEARGDRDVPELRALLEHRDRELIKAVRRKRNLTLEVRAEVEALLLLSDEG